MALDVIDNIQNITIQVEGAGEVLLEHFDNWTGSQFFYGDTNLFCQQFTIGSVGPNNYYNLTRALLRGWAENPGGSGPIYIKIFDELPDVPFPSPLTSGTISASSVPASDGDWMEVVFDPVITLNPGTQYCLVGQAPNASSDNKIYMNVDFTAEYDYPGGYLINIDLTNPSSPYFGYYDRDIAFQIFGELVE